MQWNDESSKLRWASKGHDARVNGTTQLARSFADAPQQGRYPFQSVVISRYIPDRYAGKFLKPIGTALMLRCREPRQAFVSTAAECDYLTCASSACIHSN